MAIGGIAGSALGGLQAAQNRLNVSANNVANVRSVAAESLDAAREAQNVREGQGQDGGRDLFVPSRAVNESLAGGGVRGGSQPVDPPSVPRFAPDAPDANAQGLANRPNVDLATEAVEQIRAQRAFEANLRSVEAADELAGGLLDITE